MHMETTAAMSSPTARTEAPSWVARVRFGLAVALGWGVLHVVGTLLLLPAGIDRPFVLVTMQPPVLGGLLFVLAIWVTTALTTLVTGADTVRTPLLALGIALALWCFEGGQSAGTIDSWLLRCNPQPGGPSGGPYWLLLGDYLFLIPAVVGAYLLASHLVGQPAGPRHWRQQLGLDRSAAERRDGLVALGSTALVAAIAIFFLSGPPDAQTWRGQVYFAVGLGIVAGMYAARQLVPTRDALWFWPVPLVLGVVGLLVAAVQPTLAIPPECDHLDIIPAWGLARPLPVEIVGIGLAVSMWMLTGEAPAQSRADKSK
jgi:hypothetical protein